MHNPEPNPNRKPPELPYYIDSTMRAAFATCPARFFHEFVLRLRPPGLSIDLHAGACFSAALETVYDAVWQRGEYLDHAMLRGRARFEHEWGEFEIPSYKRTAKTKERMWEAVESYFAQYPPLSDLVQPYIGREGKPTAEFSFAIPLEPVSDTPQPRHFPRHPNGEPFIYVGRFDMLGSIAGRPVVRDEKTTGSSFGQHWASKFTNRGQFIGYVWACRHCGIDVKSVIVRGVQIRKTGIEHAEAEIFIADAMQERWLEQLRRDLWRIHDAYRDGFWDRNYADACNNYGNCAYLDLCTAAQPEVFYDSYEERIWNPLHRNPVDAESETNV